jgi:integrase
MGMLVETAIEKFIKSLIQTRQITEETASRMWVSASPFLKIIGRRYFEKVTRTEVEKAIATLIKADYSGMYINDGLAVIRRMYERAVEVGLLEKNPCVGVFKPKNKRRKPIASFNNEDFEKFIAASHNHRHGLAVRIMAGTGIRRSEMAALTWADFDGEKIRINKAKSPRRTKMPKTESSIRNIYLAPELRDEMRRLKGLGAKGTILQDHRGDPLNYYTLSFVCGEIEKMCGVHVMPHMLRHYHASKLLSEKKPIAAVARRLGHSSPATTLAVYAHAFDHEDKELIGA